METKRLRIILDAIFELIMNSINKQFSTQEFISFFHTLCPIEYAEGLYAASNAKALHSWIGRWYLNGKVKEGRLNKVRNTHVISINGNMTTNVLWNNITKGHRHCKNTKE